MNKKVITHNEICEMALEPTVAIMMKQYDVMSMTSSQLMDAYYEVKDAIDRNDESFKKVNEEVIKKLKAKFGKKGQYDFLSDPVIIKAQQDFIVKRTTDAFLEKEAEKQSSNNLEDIVFF